jgi:hypothetical protein
MLWQKEGRPCNQPNENPIEVPGDPSHPLWAQVAIEKMCAGPRGQEDVKRMCLPCTGVKSFSMASIKDFCLKELDPALRSREMYIGNETWE